MTKTMPAKLLTAKIAAAAAFRHARDQPALRHAPGTTINKETALTEDQGRKYFKSGTVLDKRRTYVPYQQTKHHGSGQYSDSAAFIPEQLHGEVVTRYYRLHQLEARQPDGQLVS